MKNIALLLACIGICAFFSACGQESNLDSVEIDSVDKNQIESEMNDITTNNKRYIEMRVNDSVYKIELHDTQAANALYERLPLTLTFEDYNGIEKISYLPDSLPTNKEPDGCDPDIGDLCLYAPWGNLSIFYNDFRYSDGLIMLGHFENGIDEIGELNDDFEAIIKIAE